ncbi:DUF885 family protein [Brevibacterium jeotgali]|uniref:DUF885 family protein n=1 Tax=Brevibacterium jeotgali TaxID=1262550 RepID=UPI00319E03E4
MLDSQRLRAARVCLDIGVHCRKQAPESLGGGVWDKQKAWEFLTANVAMERSFLEFELTRYLDGPGRPPRTRSVSGSGRTWGGCADARGVSGPGLLAAVTSLAGAGTGVRGLSTLQKAMLEGSEPAPPAPHTAGGLFKTLAGG